MGEVRVYSFGTHGAEPSVSKRPNGEFSVPASVTGWHLLSRWARIVRH